MNYLQIINLIFDILFGIMGILVIHYFFFSFLGIFFCKKFPETEQKLKYGCIIPARNEELVVGNLIDSIRKNKYPQDKIDVFVIAHNCTDKTAEIARKKGAIVYEYNNENEKTMGYAFKYLFKKINDDYGVNNYDGFLLFNADNVLDEKYISKMNDAFIARNKKDVITSFRNSKNFGSNLISVMYGLYFVYGCRLECRGRTVAGCSTRVTGTGYLINSNIVKDGCWNYVTLTEDWEFTADQILKNNKIVFCDEAVFYDEQPTTFSIMWKQRVRWAKGHLLVCVTRFKDLIKSLFKSKNKNGGKNKYSIYDISINIMPLCVISTSIFILQFICVMLAPLFGISIQEAYIPYFTNLLNMFMTYYLTLVLTSILIFIIEHKRIKNVSFGKKILAVLVNPFFLFLSIPMEFVALFTKNVNWTCIPHIDTTNFGDLNEGVCKTQEIKTFND